MSDLGRDRKVKVAGCAMIALFAGLVCSLVTLHFARDAGGSIVGLFAPFTVAIGGTLHIFVKGNVQVHQAQAGGQP